MNITDLAVAGGAGIVGFALIWGLFSLIRQQKAPPLDLFKNESGSSSEGRSRLSIAELGGGWHTILGVSPEATLPEIEAAYHARLAECDRIRFSSSGSVQEKQNAETRRAQIGDAYEFIRGAKR